MKLKTEYIILISIVSLTLFIISQKSNIENFSEGYARPIHQNKKSGGSKKKSNSACNIM